MSDVKELQQKVTAREREIEILAKEMHQMGLALKAMFRREEIYRKTLITNKIKIPRMCNCKTCTTLDADLTETEETVKE